jgi:sugar phosphate isomerase/epimerase
MKHQYACADFTFPLLSHSKALQLIALLGFEGVDIGLFEERSHLFPSQEFANVEASAKKLKCRLDDLALKPADIFLQMAPDFQPYAINHPDASRRQKARDWFLCALEYAHVCGCHHVTTLPGVHFTEEGYGVSLQRTVDELAWRVAQAQEKGIVFGVEAHVGSIVPSPKQAENLVLSVPGLSLTLDYTHFTRTGLPDSEIEPLIQYASHFHVRGAQTGRLQSSFANNTINYEQVLAAMNATNYKGWVGIEYVWIDWEHCNECDNLSETILFKNFFAKLEGE